MFIMQYTHRLPADYGLGSSESARQNAAPIGTAIPA